MCMSSYVGATFFLYKVKLDAYGKDKIPFEGGEKKKDVTRVNSQL